MFKTISHKTKTVLRNPKSVLIKALYFTSPLFSDRTYLKMLFPLNLGYRLNLDNPKTFNEKLQWLKINYRRPEMTQMVDKYEAKEFARKIIGDEYIVKNYGVWDSFDDIDFENLPEKFVLKTTHDQGGVVIIKDKNNFDKQAARKKLQKHLKVKHYYLTREWPYKDVKPRILAEEVLFDGEKSQPNDYKFYCFNGEPKVMLVATERSKKAKFNYFDMDFNSVDLQQGGERSDKAITEPQGFRKMIELSKKLSKGLPHVRADFYDIDGNVYFGEMTFFDSGGMAAFEPEKWDKIWGDWIDLEQIKTK